MPEIPPHVEEMLRAQGLDDTQIEELRSTGSITHSATNASFNMADMQVTDGSATIPPEALAKLKKFHKFIPGSAIDQLERATGEDIDGDGQIGRGADHISADRVMATPAQAAETERNRVARNASGRHGDSGAMPVGSASGPFVEKSAGRRWLPWFLAFDLIVIAVVVYFVTK